MCVRIQLCAQHGVLNENFPQKEPMKFNLTVFRGSFSRLTFQVRWRTCLGLGSLVVSLVALRQPNNQQALVHYFMDKLYHLLKLFLAPSLIPVWIGS